jgi:hypothetical protein
VSDNVNREYKNSVFIDLFGQNKYRMQLFRALHPEMDDVTDADLKTITLKQVITNHPYNDLALQVRGQLMIFVEAQSTWSFNILIRILLYYADTVQGYILDHNLDIHSSKRLTIPAPEFYVIYTGMKKVHRKITLKKNFYKNKSCGADLEARVIQGESKDIIGQYIVFCHVMDEQVRKHGRTRKAAEETIRICRKRNVLEMYLKEREKEVINIMITLFDQKYAVEQYGKVQKEEGFEKGWRKGRRKGCEEGKITEFISIRKEDGWKRTDIIKKVIDRFGVDKKEAEKYYKGVHG